MKRRNLLTLILLSTASVAAFSLVSCTSTDAPSPQNSAFGSPAAYIPPPSDAPAPPAAGSGQWIGPNGYAGQ